MIAGLSRAPSLFAQLGSLARLYNRFLLRPLWHEPIRTGLTVLAIALGVSVVVAIDLAGEAAAGSFQSSVETLSGKASLIITAPGGVDEKLLGSLSQLPYPLELNARIEDHATPSGHGAAVPFIGIDLVHNAAPENANNSDDWTAFTNPIFAGTELGWHKGQEVKLLINDRLQSFTVAGIIPKSESAVSEDNVVVADIALAQNVTGKLGRLDSISVVAPDSAPVSYWQRMLRNHVPPSVSVEPAGARTTENRKMLSGFRWNLRVLSYIALVVGAFLIYNTISVSVVRRRPEIGILRAIGANRSIILTGFLAEAAVFGIVGSIAGLMLGRFLALSAVNLIGNTVQSLYVSSQPSPVRFDVESLIGGFSAGLFISVAAALLPAIEASRVAPTEAMARGRREHITRVRWRRNFALGLLFAALSAVTGLQPAVDGRPLFGYLSALLMIASAAVLIPNVVAASSLLLGPVVQRAIGIEAFLAFRGLRTALNRSSILVGALATAVAMMASVGIMVGSFRQTVAVWMDNQLRADFYLRPAGSSAADRHPTIDPKVADDIERLGGVAAVDRFRVYPITYEGLPASLGGGETSKVQASSATFFLPGENRFQILQDLPRGDNVVVSEPFANKHGIKPGDYVRLPLGGAIRPFRVLGVYYDYSTERGFVIMDRRTLLKYLPDRAASNLAVYLAPNIDRGAVRTQIEHVIGGRGVMVFNNAKLRHDALVIFDRTFAVTWALEVVAIIVAIVGMAGALLALVIDRRREFALLRFLGAGKPQIRRIILAEAGFLGLFANVVGAVLGTALSLLLIFVINKQSFGWTIQFHWPVSLLLAALTGVYFATFLAGLYPARTAVRLNPIEAVHEE